MGRVGGELAELAAAIGEGLRTAGGAPPELYELARGMAHAGLSAELARAAFAEARARRPKAARIDGFVFLLGAALDELRLRGNGGSTAAKRELDMVMALLGVESAKGGAEPGMLMALARALTMAGLPPPTALQKAMVAGIDVAAHYSGSEAHPGKMQADLDKIAQELGDDPFRIQSEMAAMAAAFPVEHRCALIHGLALSANAEVRAAGLGFVLDPEERCALVALSAAREGAQRYSPPAINVARLVRMRPWLPQTRHAATDELIAHLRRTASAPEPAAHGEVKQWFTTAADGAGAQSLFALIKEGRMWAAASVLVKHGEGVCDAWVADGMSKREAAELAAQFIEEADAVEVTSDFFVQRVGDALAGNAEANPPPFGLVQVLEAVAFGPLPPRAVSPAAICEALLSAAPDDQIGAEALAHAQASAPRWRERIGTIDTWFEADETVEALLGPIRGRKKRVAAVLAEILPLRREFWAGRVAWTAAALRAKSGVDPILTPLWIDMALVARAIVSDAPLAGMPLMRLIADDTVRVFEGRDF